MSFPGVWVFSVFSDNSRKTDCNSMLQEEIANQKEGEKPKEGLPFFHWICQPYIRPGWVTYFDTYRYSEAFSTHTISISHWVCSRNLLSFRGKKKKVKTLDYFDSSLVFSQLALCSWGCCSLFASSPLDPPQISLWKVKIRTPSHCSSEQESDVQQICYLRLLYCYMQHECCW